MPCPLVLHATAPLTLVVATPLTKMAANKNTKKARVARARHVAAQRNNRTTPVASPLRPRPSTRGSRRITQEGSDESHSEGPGGNFGRQQFRPSTQSPKTSNSVVPDIEALRATRNPLQAYATSAASQAETVGRSSTSRGRK